MIEVLQVYCKFLSSEILKTHLLVIQSTILNLVVFYSKQLNDKANQDEKTVKLFDYLKLLSLQLKVKDEVLWMELRNRMSSHMIITSFYKSLDDIS